MISLKTKIQMFKWCNYRCNTEKWVLRKLMSLIFFLFEQITDLHIELIRKLRKKMDYNQTMRKKWQNTWIIITNER